MSIIVVSFNTRDLTLACLRSVVKYEPDAQVIVVDNASSDGSVEAIQQEFPEITLVAVEKNIGFGRANNLGMRHATSELVVLLNSDAELRSSALTVCAKLLGKRPELAAVTPRLRGLGGVEQASKHPVPTLRATIRRAFNGTPLDFEDDDFWIPGTCMVVRRTAIERAGGLFDPSLFIYWEDADLCARLKRCGYQIAVANTEVMHHGGASGGGPNCTAKSGLHAWYTYGRHFWYRQHRSQYEAIALWLFEVVDAARCIVRGIVRPSKREEIRYGLTLLTTLARLAVGLTPSFAVPVTHGRRDDELIDRRRSSFGKAGSGKPDRRESATAVVGVVVIGRNEGERLEACLNSLMYSEAPVVYVDSNSTDDSVALATSYGVGVVSLDPAKPMSAARARNAGAAWLREHYPETDYIQFVDGDCELDEQWLDVAGESLSENTNAAVVCGVLRERNTEGSVYNRLCQMEWRRGIGVIDSCGGIFLARAAAFEEVNGFDDALEAGEEPDLCRRLRQDGWEIHSIAEPMATHDAGITSFRQWWRRTKRAGFAAAALAHRERDSDARPYTKRTRSNLAWCAALPIGLLVGLVSGNTASLILIGLVYTLLGLRIGRSMRARGEYPDDARTYALFTTIGKVPQTLGAVAYAWSRISSPSPVHSRANQSEATPYSKQTEQISNGLRIAYLTTEYPKASHTFVRREIVALEQCGHHVERFSIRDTGAITDPADQAERERTTFLLNLGLHRHAINVLRTAVTRPTRFSSAAWSAYQVYRESDRGWLRHVAYLVEAASLLQLLRQRRVQHIHVHFGKNAADVAYLVHALGGPTYSMQIHGPGEFDGPKSFSLGRKVRGSLFTTAITNYATAQLRRWTDYECWQKLHIVRCGVNETFLDAYEPLETDSRTLVSVGRLTAQKGQLLLIDALAAARARGCDAKLILAGDGEMRAVIEDRINELGLADAVMITGWIGEEEVRQRILRSRALVLPSFAEGLPVAIMESLALGRPVISTMITGIPELVVHGENGWLLPPGDSDRLAEAICDCLTTPLSQINDMGRRGADAVRTRHDASKESAKLSALLNRYVSERTHAGADRCVVGDVLFDRFTSDDTLTRIDQLIAARTPTYFITANVNYLMLCEQHPELKAVNDAAAFILADGMPIVWRSWLTGKPIPERVAGADLIYAIAAQAAAKGHRLFLLGAESHIALLAAQNLRRLNPGLQIVGVESPPFRPLSETEEEELICRVRESNADLLLVALGQPHGEMWLHRNRQRLGVPVSVQLGGSFNFVAGSVRRCPQWIANLSCEWLWRVACEPAKLARRYRENIGFVARRLLGQRLGTRCH